MEMKRKAVSNGGPQSVNIHILDYAPQPVKRNSVKSASGIEAIRTV
jgi:hypothetical protein